MTRRGGCSLCRNPPPEKSAKLLNILVAKSSLRGKAPFPFTWWSMKETVSEQLNMYEEA